MAASDQEVQIENGVRVIRPRRNGPTGGSLVMKVPDAAPATAEVPVADDRLLEPGASGPLPRIGSDGRRPAEVYAGAAGPGSTGKPWISIVVRGLGNDPGGAAQDAGRLALPASPWGLRSTEPTSRGRSATPGRQDMRSFW